MPKRIPVTAASNVGRAHDCRQVIVLAWDGERTHIVTWGKTIDDCSQAADGGNVLKARWGWPESNNQPSRVRKLQAENEALRKEILKLRSWYSSDIDRKEAALKEFMGDKYEPPIEVSL
jgi:hypothetical protein